MEKILIDYGFEKKGSYFIRTCISNKNSELKAEITIGFRNDKWVASVKYFSSRGACGLGDFRCKSLKRLISILKKDCECYNF